MKNRLFRVLALGSALIGQINAGGFQISATNLMPLLETSSWFSINYLRVDPNIKPVFPGVDNTVVQPFSNYGGFVKLALPFGLDGMIENYQPYRTTFDYPIELYRIKADLDSSAWAVSLRTRLAWGFSLIGSQRWITIDSVEASLPMGGIPPFRNQDKSTFNTQAFALAYEYPDIHLKLVLGFDRPKDFSITTTIPSNPLANASAPKEIFLRGETGISTSTLAFASYVREYWSKAQLSLLNFPLTDFIDTYTAQVGLTQRVLPNLAITGMLNYTPKDGETSNSLLSATNGSTGISFGLTYFTDNYRVTAGRQRLSYGDRTVQSPLFPGASIDFKDSTADLTFVEGKIKVF